MSTGVFKRNIFGELEEVKQEYIDAWCKMCRFPYGESKCQSKELIQRCWNELQAIADTLKINSQAHIWHLQHECPGIQRGKACSCNKYKSIKESFEVEGLVYKG